MGVLALPTAESTRLAPRLFDLVLFLAVFTDEDHAMLLGLSLTFLRAVLRLSDFGWFDAIRLTALITLDCFHRKHRDGYDALRAPPFGAREKLLMQ